ncbi:hypothetical protein L6452_13038 [Arctium lappa]|uniref:Uncharacterized protein n=1 Tax=Arctium lappa TaxID=4217 RepID=A0ACB9CH52_ARCLA|nr:hypothetical protein L6452_13038 [Arctium lappa]
MYKGRNTSSLSIAAETSSISAAASRPSAPEITTPFQHRKMKTTRRSASSRVVQQGVTDVSFGTDEIDNRQIRSQSGSTLHELIFYKFVL